MKLNPDRFFSSEPTQRKWAREIYESTRALPIISPHGHTDPTWFADNKAFANAADLLIVPDHYILRMLYSQGHGLESLGRRPLGASPMSGVDPRAIWKRFAKSYKLFLGTPSRIWMDHVLSEIFLVTEPLTEESSDRIFDHIGERLQSPEYLPNALLDRFKIDFLSTTDSPIDDLSAHKKINASQLKGRVVPCFRPDDVTDPAQPNFLGNLAKLAEITGKDAHSYTGYLDALKAQRLAMKSLGATATDHGHPSAFTVALTNSDAKDLFAKLLAGKASSEDHEIFRGHMLMRMAEMSLSDGLVMQLHPGSFRNHNQSLFEKFGRDVGADIPQPTEYVRALKPLLNAYGNDPKFSLIVFTLDESTYSRELAPLAGHYPSLKLGPAWWFHDSPNGMLRFREQVTETAGFYNTVGFNDDTRAFFSIPARHDLARRIDARYLAKLVSEHHFDLSEAKIIAKDLAYNLVKAAYHVK